MTPTKKFNVVISTDAYETLELVAQEYKSTVTDLASAWLQEKVKTELEIRLKETLPDWTKPSAWILNKRAEEAELAKQAHELYAAKFPTIPPAELMRHWLDFLNTVHTVREAEKRKQEAVKREQEAEEV